MENSKSSTSTIPTYFGDTSLMQFQSYKEELEMLMTNSERVEISDYFLEYNHLFDTLVTSTENTKRMKTKNKKLHEKNLDLSKDINRNMESSEKNEQLINTLIIQAKKMTELQEDLKTVNLDNSHLDKEIKYIEER